MIQLPPDTPWFIIVFFLAATSAVWLARRYIEGALREREAKWQLAVDEQRTMLDKTRKDADERTILLQTLRDLITQIAESNKIAGEERQQARIERATYIAAFDTNRGDINEVRKALLASLKVLRDIARKLSVSAAADPTGSTIDTTDLDTTIQLLQSDAYVLQIDAAAAKRASQTVEVVKGKPDDQSKSGTADKTHLP